MEINILEESKNKIVIELPGEGHSLCNAIKQALWNNKNVSVSGYNISHPLVGIPKIVVETTSGSPKDALVAAVKDVKKESDSFLKVFEKTLK